MAVIMIGHRCEQILQNYRLIAHKRRPNLMKVPIICSCTFFLPSNWQAEMDDNMNEPTTFIVFNVKNTNCEWPKLDALRIRIVTSAKC
jgi:hypothetical protein